MKPLLAAALLLLLPALGAAAEKGTLLKDDTLRKQPYSDAATVAQIKRGQSVDILTRNGAWLQIKSGKASGWVRLLSVRRGAASGGGDAGSVLKLASGRSGTGQIVSTTGVRGLSAEELKAASFNEAEVAQLEANSVNAAQAQQFAKAGGLQAVTLKYLPPPGSGGAQ